MRVLLVGNGEFFHVGAFFKRGLESLEYEHAFVDYAKYLDPLRHSFFHKVAFRLMQRRRPLTYWAFNKDIYEAARGFRPDVVLITGGNFISPRMLERVKADTGAILINFSTDDPFNPIVSTPEMRTAIPFYDIFVCTKRAVMEDVRRAGCGKVVFVPFGYEPSLHFPEQPETADEKARFTSDVMFAGGGDKDRFPVLRALAGISGLNLHLYGEFWDTDLLLKPSHRGFARGRDYRLALCGAKIDLCLVRRANRDGHVMRTFEVPACGGFMLAERTEEHLELFEEDKEAVYFSSDEELVDKVRYYLTHDAERQQIAEAGYRKVTSGGHTYRDVLEAILSLQKSG